MHFYGLPVVCVALWTASAALVDTSPATTAPENLAVSEAKKILHDKDTFAAIEFIEGREPLQAAQLYMDLSDDLYGKDKNLPHALAIGRAGVQYCLGQSQHNKADERLSRRFRGAAKALTYNIASFTWPGWGEAGIDISGSDLAGGLDAARCNLRLSSELGGDAKSLANAHWIVGAMQLALRHYDDARASFEQCLAQNKAAKDREAELMAAGWLNATDILAGKDVAEADESLTKIVQQLEQIGSEDAKVYSPQFKTALKVLKEQK